LSYTSQPSGIPIHEYQTDFGPADYILFVNKKPVGLNLKKSFRNNRSQALDMILRKTFVIFAEYQLNKYAIDHH
jgi:hypothetical protein